MPPLLCGRYGRDETALFRLAEIIVAKATNSGIVLRNLFATLYEKLQ